MPSKAHNISGKQPRERKNTPTKLFASKTLDLYLMELTHRKLPAPARLWNHPVLSPISFYLITPTVSVWVCVGNHVHRDVCHFENRWDKRCVQAKADFVQKVANAAKLRERGRGETCFSFLQRFALFKARRRKGLDALINFVCLSATQLFHLRKPCRLRGR